MLDIEEVRTRFLNGMCSDADITDLIAEVDESRAELQRLREENGRLRREIAARDSWGVIDL